MQNNSSASLFHDAARAIGHVRDVTLSASAVTNVPLAEIDRIFLHPQGLPLWDQSVARVELLSSGAFGVGFRFDTIGPRHQKRSSYIVTNLSPTMWQTDLINSRFLAHAVWTMEFEPHDDQTRVTCTVAMTMRWWCAPLGLVFRRLTPGMRRDMRLLKEAIERRRAVAGSEGARRAIGRP